MEIIFDPIQPRMYRDLAWLWPLISPPEDYIAEALQFVDLIRRYGSSRDRRDGSAAPLPSLLHLGCGGGHLDHTLQKYFQVSGVDLSPDMLALAKKLNPQVSYQTGDMRSFSIDQRFDAVMIADSIDYMLDETDLRLAFQTAYHALIPGGVFVTYAEQTKERFAGDQVDCAMHSAAGLHVALIEDLFDPDPNDSTYSMTFTYLIRRENEPDRLTYEIDHHLSGLFPEATWREILNEVGFTVYQEEFLHEESSPGGLTWFIGVKSS